MAVVIYHEAEDSSHWFNIGAFGVSIFFVISGFIMFAITESSEQRPAIFLRKRITRIAPLYWSITILSVFLCIVHPNLMWHEDIGFRHLVASLLFIPSRGYTFPMSIQPTLLQGWTLNIEMFFYAVMTAALFFPRRIQLPLVSLVLLGLVESGRWFNPQSAPLMAYTDGHMLEFVAGLWIGRLWVSGHLPSRRPAMLMLGASFGALAMEQWGGFPARTFEPLFAAFIILGAVSVEEDGGIFCSTFFKVLGDASFSIYLLHSIVEAVVNRLHLPFFVKVGCAIGLSAVVGVAVFYGFERPVNEWVRRMWPNPEPAPALARG